MPKKSHSPKAAAFAGLERYQRRKAYIVIEHTVSDDPTRGDSEPEIRGSYATLDKANAAAKKMLIKDLGEDHFDNYEETVDEEGRVVAGGRAEADDIYVYVQERGEAFKTKPVLVVMKADSLAKDAPVIVHSLHINIASANICIAALAAEFRDTEEGAQGAIVVEENDKGFLGLRYNKEGTKKGWVVAEAKFMKQMDFTMEHKGPWDSGRRESEDEAGSDDEDDSEGEENSEPGEDEPKDISPPSKKRARRG